MLGINWKPFNQEQESLILSAIKEAETKTSGEIRLHIDKYCKTDPVYKARNRFIHLKMEETQLRNGVLIYVALKDHKLAIIGDIGISKKLSPGFWEETLEGMLALMRNEQVVEGLCLGIEKAGEQLAKYFPCDTGGKNELPDDISYA